MQLMHGDCLDVLRGMADNSIDSIVTDPPYGLSFMGKKWDYDVPSVEIWAECLRVLKPGGHLLAFAGTRTQHRMAVRIEDAGFEIRDMIAWVYGSGFPKSHDVSKAIDKAAGAEREVIGVNPTFRKMQDEASAYNLKRNEHLTAPATEAARQWQGWGTALKPALEPITMARKPLVGTVAANVLEWGTGAINVDGCRVAGDKASGSGQQPFSKGGVRQDTGASAPNARHGDFDTNSGRWPANFIHDGSDEVLAGFPQARSAGDYCGKETEPRNSANYMPGQTRPGWGYANTGSAARFFYCAKASKKDRDEGLESFIAAKTNDGRAVDADNAYQRGATLWQNTHPTVKPTDLMAYLCRLVTPPGGVVLDPFMGSGSTGKAAMREGFDFIGIEKDAGYFAIAQRRIEQAQQQLFAGVAA